MCFFKICFQFIVTIIFLRIPFKIYRRCVKLKVDTFPLRFYSPYVSMKCAKTPLF